MNGVLRLGQVVAWVAQRRLWLFVAASIVFWTLLYPLALVWLALMASPSVEGKAQEPAGEAAAASP